jgi:hypothetical protein
MAHKPKVISSNRAPLSNKTRFLWFSHLNQDLV